MSGALDPICQWSSIGARGSFLAASGGVAAIAIGTAGILVFACCQRTASSIKIAADIV